MKAQIYFILISLTLFAACQPKLKFNKEMWNTKDDIAYANRPAMVDDLVQHHQIKGLTYRQLIDAIGEPQQFEKDSTEVYYEIETNYGSDIDPVSGKDLIIKLNKDSIVTGYQIREWKH